MRQDFLRAVQLDPDRILPEISASGGGGGRPANRTVAGRAERRGRVWPARPRASETVLDLRQQDVHASVRPAALEGFPDPSAPPPSQSRLRFRSARNVVER